MDKPSEFRVKLFNRDTVIVFFLLLITFGYFYNDSGFNGNSRLGLTFGMVERNMFNLYTGDIEVKSSPLYTEDVAVYNDNYYTDKAIGSSVLAAIFYWPIYKVAELVHMVIPVETKKHLLTFLSIGLLSSISGVLIFWLSNYLSKNRTIAYLVTMSLSLGTLLLPYSVSFFGHAQAAFFLFTSFFLTFLISIPENAAYSIKRRYTFLIGLFMGTAFLIEYPTAILIPVLILYYFYNIWKKGEAKRIANYLFPLIGGLIPIFVMVFYNQRVYGTAFTSGYQYLADTYFKEKMSTGFMGIGFPKFSVIFYETFHPAQGIFWLSPVLLMIFIGAFFLLRKKKYRVELLISGYAFLSFLLMNSGYYMWWGGNSLGPRAVIPMLPFLCIPLSFISAKWTPALIVLSVISIGQMILASSCQFLIPANYIPTIGQDPFFHYSNIYSNVMLQLLDGRFGWNMGKAFFGLKTWFSLVPLIFSQLLLSVVFFTQRQDKK